MALLQSLEDKEFAANVKMLRKQVEELTNAVAELTQIIKQQTTN